MGKNTLLCCLLLWGAAIGQEDVSEEPSSEGDVTTEMPTDEEDDGLVSVKTFQGIIKGSKEESDEGTPYFQFLGIPYAKPPVRDLRFKPPQPSGSFGTLVATKDVPFCPQVNQLAGLTGYSGEEDCLYLNIYTPSITTSVNPFALKSVMLWIHGGGFTTGSGGKEVYDPSPLLDKDVVVVSINYRLGALGFASFGNNHVEGNMGLKDQALAIKWVKNYIQYFGGDPEKITLFGESAGGISVHAHVLSPYNHGLLSGAIAQSGTMLYSRGLSGPKETMGSGKIAEIFNCSSTNYDEEMLRCLQDVPVQELLERCTTDPENWFDPEASHLMFGPIVDSFASEPFMPLQPLEALRTGVYNQIPFMSGTTKDDGSVLLIPMYDNLEQLSEDWSAFAPQLLSLSEVDEPTIISSILKKYYVGDEFSQENKQSLSDMFTDATFLAPDQKTVELMSKQRSPVFNYQITYKGTSSMGPLFGEAGKNEDFGVVHGDDLLYLFNSNLITSLLPDVEWNEDDFKMKELMLTYWTNFAKYGNPTPFKMVDVSNWNSVYDGQMNYLDLKPEPEMKQSLEPERMLLWDRMVWSKQHHTMQTSNILKKAVKLFLRYSKKQNNF